MSIASIHIKWPQNGGTGEATFDLKPGVTALIGPSGAGKTTLARLICGLETSGRGTIELNGRALQDETVFLQPQERSVGLVMQDPALFPTMTVRENITLGQQIDHKALESLIDITDITPHLDKLPNTLSGGEARRVAIVRSLAADPDLLILDEPMNGLDPRRRRDIMSLIRELAHTSGTPVLMITHQLEEMLFAADHALLMEDGKLCVSGSVEDVLSADDTARLLGIDDAGSLLSAMVSSREDGLLSTKIGSQHLYIKDDGEPEGAKLRLRVLARDVAISKAPVDQISVLNQLKATVSHIQKDKHDAIVHLTLDGGDASLRSRITAKSLAALSLKKGDTAYALVKAVAVKEMVAEA